LCKKGDILFCVRGSSTGRINIANDEYCIGRGVAAIRAKNGMSNTSYIEQELLFSTLKILKLTTGSTFPSIDKNTLNNIKIFVPPLPEQENIAEILGCWDQGIEVLEKLIAAKQKRKKGLMQQLLTGKKRFKEFKGQKWDTVHLGEVFKHRVERGNDHLPLLAITGADGVMDREELERRDTSNTDKSKYLRICPGDIGYNTMRMWQGVSGVSNLEGIISPAYTVCIPNRKKADSQFVGYLFKFHPVVFLFYRYSQGLVSDTWNLKFNHFSEIRVTIPSLEEQQKIASVLNAADQEIELLQKKLEVMKQQKKGLMQKLLTGKIRVKV
jgi:type I restriction enzyme S subunit